MAVAKAGASSSGIEKKKVITPQFRVSFPAVFEPKAFEGQAAKYSMTMLFKKDTDLANMKNAVRAAAEEKWGAKEKWPKGLRLPFRDGDEKSDKQGYEGNYFVNATSKHRPGLVDKQKRPILVQDDFYAGCYARAEVIAFAYDKAGNKGVSFSLQNIQKLDDGEAFSGRKAAEDVFDAVEDGSEDASSYAGALDSTAAGDDYDF